MSHRRITHLRLAPPADWTKIGERLAARLASEPGSVALQLVRVDDERAVLLASAAERDTLVRLDGVLASWLAELPCVEPPMTVLGETTWAFDRSDAWAHVDALDEVGRCEHFVRDVIASGSVWGLYDKTWARSMAAAGREALPLWPQRELAARCIAGP